MTKGSDQWRSAVEAARQRTEQAYSDLAGLSVEKQKQFVVGKVAAHDVAAVPEIAGAAAGVPASAEPVIVRAGETITMSQADEAAALGLLPQLVRAAGETAAHDAYAKTMLKAASALTGSRAARGLHARAASAALGKTAGQAVLAPDGTLVLAQGELVTEAALERARECNREAEVLAAAGMGAARESVDQIKETAGGLWQRVKQKALELAEPEEPHLDPLEAAELDARVQRALGRRVARPILDHHDTPILMTGQEVTLEAVDRARHAGVLDILLKAAGI